MPTVPTGRAKHVVGARDVGAGLGERPSGRNLIDAL